MTTIRPNVLLVTADHWPGDLLGAEGHPCVQTPTLDELARSGVRFPRAYSESPTCLGARRTLMTGCSPRLVDSRSPGYTDGTPPDVQTLAQVFRDAGYQAYAVGKLHVYPQRSRVGFDDVTLGEEGRAMSGLVDDYELYLGERGYAGQYFTHGMGNNEYVTRPWHLPEEHHVTNWATREMVRAIKRRDPTRPALWYLSYCHPHPPLVPLQAYLDIYREMQIDVPSMGEWADDPEALPYRLRAPRDFGELRTDREIRQARRAFYALCTHIDHQLRVVIGTLREEGVLDDTTIVFSSDHGDLLGKHGLWRKSLFYEDSARVPMIVLGTEGDERVGFDRVDDRLVGLQDVMPTVLDLAGVPVPDWVGGLSMVGDERRDHIYGECGEGVEASRMVCDGRFKFVYYAAGNRSQLFDLADDPEELVDLAESTDHQGERKRLEALLVGELYGDDIEWAREDELVGLPDIAHEPRPNRGLSGQTGGHWPPPPATTP